MAGFIYAGETLIKEAEKSIDNIETEGSVGGENASRGKGSARKAW